SRRRPGQARCRATAGTRECRLALSYRTPHDIKNCMNPAKNARARSRIAGQPRKPAVASIRLTARKLARGSQTHVGQLADEMRFRGRPVALVTLSTTCRRRGLWFNDLT